MADFQNTLDYCLQHSDKTMPLLELIARETQLQVLLPRMLSGEMQGKVLIFLSQLMRPNLVVEIGTFTGYSAICLAQGLGSKGRLITIDKNEELASRVKRYIAIAGLTSRVELQNGKAAELIPLLPDAIDLAFIDADKENNDLYYEMLLPKMRAGGLVIVDNVLWSEKVIDLEKNNDKATLQIHRFNQKCAQDERVTKLMLPIRDGLLLLQKK